MLCVFRFGTWPSGYLWVWRDVLKRLHPRFVLVPQHFADGPVAIRLRVGDFDGTWDVGYLLRPARAGPQPLMVPANSTILRWNEIATALGHTGTQVALQPAGGFFLSDVEKVVEEALTRNLKSHESAA